MAKKVDKAKLKKFLLAEVARVNEDIRSPVIMNAMGDAVIDEMKDMISKGISPIEGRGRFPEYKGPSQSRSLKKQAQDFKKEAAVVPGYTKYQRRISESILNKASSLQKTASQLKKRTYPFTVQKEFPGKRPRPVNLFLSGTFLDKLKKFITGTGTNVKLEIGFSDKKAMEMEDGHRVGWNGQGKRPIIPQAGERFAQRIQQIVEQTLSLNIEKYLKVRRR